jgi:hypothetical protein
MQYITPKTSFALKRNDISVSDTIGDYPVTNNTGTINTIRTAMTWYSVDITITLTTEQGTLPNINAGQLFPFQNYGFVITPVS